MIKTFKSVLKKYLALSGLSFENSLIKFGTGLPDWRPLLENSALWNKSVEQSQQGPSILIPTSVGGFSAGVILESLLGVALTLRGAKVRFLLCDGVLPACLQVHAGKVKSPEVISSYKLAKEICPSCILRGKSVYESIGLPISYYSEFISLDEIKKRRQLAHEIALEDIRAYTEHGIAIGEHAMAGALRFVACGNLPNTPEAENILRRYFEAALITESVMQAAQNKYSPEIAVFHHGIYVPQGIIGEVLRLRNVRVVNWNVGYRKQCFIFSHKETYHQTQLDESVNHWENISWNELIEKEILTYLKSRWFGSNDWIWFHDQPKHDAAEISKEIGIDFSKPTISLLTNVFWDAQLHFKANAFKDMLDWLLQTIEYFTHRKDLQLAIRIHPAEVRGSIPSRQPIVEEIAKVYPQLTENIFIIPPESQVSTYVLCENSDSVIIYGTKMGVELTSLGIPVIVAGEAWIRNKGLTLDAVSPETYFSILDKLPLRTRLTNQQLERSRKYAFHFFFRRFIPLKFMEPSQNAVPYKIQIQSLECLLPGKDQGLDVICEGIIHEKDFIYPAERYLC